MSSEPAGVEQPTKPGRVWWIVGGVAAGVIVLMVLLSMGRPTPQKVRSTEPVAKGGDRLESARQALAADNPPPTVSSVHSALQQINLAFTQGTEPPPAMPPEEMELLKKTCGLDAGDLEEIVQNNYTPLDDVYVAYCLLLRDVAQSLEITLAGQQAELTRAEQVQRRLDQVRLAFDWVVRQVRLQRGLLGVRELVTTPDLVLRLGFGSAEDRAKIFLGLLRQIGTRTGSAITDRAIVVGDAWASVALGLFGQSTVAGPAAYLLEVAEAACVAPWGSKPEIAGAMLCYTDAKGEQQLWACGVDIGDDRGLYLFDPRLGMPLPGPDGKGIATLREVVAHPELLDRLKVPDGPKYDVTPKDAAESKAYLFCPLNAMSPRMRHLQDELLPPSVEVRLGIDVVGELARLKRAAMGQGKEPVAEVWDPPPPPEKAKGILWPDGKVRWPDGVRTWRYFLTKTEGGTALEVPVQLSYFPGYAPYDPQTLVRLPWKTILQWGIVPWFDIPPDYFHANQLDFAPSNEMGINIRNIFQEPFVDAVFAPGARDLRLRGRMRDALPLLNAERQKWTDAQQRLSNASREELDRSFEEWKKKAVEVYARFKKAAKSSETADEAKVELTQVWKEAVAVILLLHDGIARTRNVDITYEIALCKHEEAERAQARLQLLEQEKKAEDADRQEVKAAWREARQDWSTFLQDCKARADGPRGKNELAMLYRSNLIAAALRLRARTAAKVGDWTDAIKDWKDPAAARTEGERLANLYHANLPSDKYK
jgi:hypothetical protein